MPSLGINKGVWDSLSASDQSLLQTAAAAENSYVLAEFNARSSDALDPLINEHGIQVRQMSDEVLNGLGEASGQVVSEIGAEGGITQRVYESSIGFRKKALAYDKLSNLAFGNARLLPFTYAG